jgi:L-fuconolactonase
VIDAHVHFWPGRLDWMGDELAALHRPFGPEDLRPSLEANGVERIVLVEAQTNVEETRSLLALAETVDFVGGVIGWVDLTSPGVGDVLAELSESPYLVGIRHHVHDEPDPDWLLRPDVRRGLRAVEAAGLAYDLLLRPRELPAGLAAARAFPELRLVIDHLAKPPVATGELEPWATLMAPFAGLEHVWCKISGLAVEADWERWTPADLEPYVSRAVEWFGEERLIFGSDWPVCLLAASYDEVFQAYGAGRFGAGAATFYELPSRSRQEWRGS